MNDHVDGDMPGPVGPRPAPVLVVGLGLLGQQISRVLLATGTPVKGVSRGSAGVDLFTQAGRRMLVALLRAAGSRDVVLCHGPSEVTWCEGHEREATAAHAETAVTVTGHGARVLLVSTDNVFPGDRPAYGVGDQPEPANAYGRAKRAAEEAVLGSAGGRVLRVSLVYGWSDGRHRRNYAEECLMSLRRGRRVIAPTDQVLAPVLVDDVAEVVAAIVHDRGAAASLVHLGGPVALSRYAFARLAAQAIGAPLDLVVAARRQDTRWACRPAHSVLSNGSSHPSWPPVGELTYPAEGLARMVATWPD